jgi:hypothetical protein
MSRAMPTKRRDFSLQIFRRYVHVEIREDGCDRLVFYPMDEKHVEQRRDKNGWLKYK